MRIFGASALWRVINHLQVVTVVQVISYPINMIQVMLGLAGHAGMRHDRIEIIYL
jgi:hypothetical protein